jgi:MYXO-CTERM domain-containing protein
MWKRARSSLLLLTLTSSALGLTAAPTRALAQDALPDVVPDVLNSDAADTASDVASSETGDASDGGSDTIKTDAGASDVPTTTPADAAPATDTKVDAPRSTLDDDDGCGCRIGGHPSSGSAGLFTVLGSLAAVGFTVRRRRRR